MQSMQSICACSQKHSFPIITASEFESAKSHTDHENTSLIIYNADITSEDSVVATVADAQFARSSAEIYRALINNIRAWRKYMIEVRGISEQELIKENHDAAYRDMLCTKLLQIAINNQNNCGNLRCLSMMLYLNISMHADNKVHRRVVTTIFNAAATTFISTPTLANINAVKHLAQIHPNMFSDAFVVNIIRQIYTIIKSSYLGIICTTLTQDSVTLVTVAREVLRINENINADDIPRLVSIMMILTHIALCGKQNINADNYRAIILIYVAIVNDCGLYHKLINAFRLFFVAIRHHIRDLIREFPDSIILRLFPIFQHAYFTQAIEYVEPDAAEIVDVELADGEIVQMQTNALASRSSMLYLSVGRTARHSPLTALTKCEKNYASAFLNWCNVGEITPIEWLKLAKCDKNIARAAGTQAVTRIQPRYFNSAYLKGRDCIKCAIDDGYLSPDRMELLQAYFKMYKIMDSYVCKVGISQIIFALLDHMREIPSSVPHVYDFYKSLSTNKSKKGGGGSGGSGSDISVDFIGNSVCVRPVGDDIQILKFAIDQHLIMNRHLMFRCADFRYIPTPSGKTYHMCFCANNEQGIIID
jgi:hypothetical protein